jgi:hypothetical protein
VKRYQCLQCRKRSGDLNNVRVRDRIKKCYRALYNKLTNTLFIQFMNETMAIMMEASDGKKNGIRCGNRFPAIGNQCCYRKIPSKMKRFSTRNGLKLGEEYHITSIHEIVQNSRAPFGTFLSIEHSTT